LVAQILVAHYCQLHLWTSFQFRLKLKSRTTISNLKSMVSVILIKSLVI
jgi:hypothetical protein